MSSRSELVVIHSRYVVPDTSRKALLREHSLVFNKDGEVIDLLPTIEARRRYHCCREISHSKSILVPSMLVHKPLDFQMGFPNDFFDFPWMQEFLSPSEREEVSIMYFRQVSAWRF
eukprot:TRINITY_DN3805_c0_g1_i2.p1 TRINITY_DN3805_c0_g1~~TRINITY_DN3805_c0_g1_i2.p1  ORF type:complete len:116 (-),score=23.54 TRINITY_DN3805_c0_g1_i2:57-404(-)